MNNVLSMRELREHDSSPTTSGGRLRFCCPLPACAGKPVNRNHQSLSVEPASGVWHCHRCNSNGKLREFFEDRPFTPVSQKKRALQTLQKQLMVSQPAIKPPIDLNRKEGLRQLLEELKPLQASPGADYLQSRGIPLEAADRAGVRYHPMWYGCPAVVFCLEDENRACVAAQGRYIDGQSNPKTRSAGLISGGVFLTENSWVSETIVLCEAPIDALSLAVAGMPALALCGTALRDSIPKRLAFKRVLLAFDADEAGDNAARNWSAALRFGTTNDRLRPEGAKDWNEILCTFGEEFLRNQIGLGDPFYEDHLGDKENFKRLWKQLGKATGWRALSEFVGREVRGLDDLPYAEFIDCYNRLRSESK